MEQQKANVLIVCAAGIVSGKEIMTLELGRGLKAKGQPVHVLTSVWSDESFPSRLEEIGLPFDRLPLGFISLTLTWQCLNWTYGQLVRWPELLRDYGALLKTQKPQTVIHTNWHHLLLLYPFLRVDRDWFWVHDVIPHKPQYKKLFQMLSRRLQHFVPVSHAVAASLRNLGIPDQKVRVIHNGLTDPAAGTERVASTDGIVKLGIVGQIGPWKGHEDLLEAFGQIVERFPKIELHIFGNKGSDYESQLRRQIAELGVTDRVIWHGFLKERAEIFRSLDILAIPSRVEESFGLVAAEAGFFALPLVATKQGGVPEIISDGITGILVQASDPPALAAGIERLLVDPNLRSSMGLNARKRMLSHFSIERFTGDFLLLLGSHNNQ